MKIVAKGLNLSAALGVILAASASFASVAPVPVQAEVIAVVPTMQVKVSERAVSFQHVTIELPVDFDVFNRNLIYLLGRFDPADFDLATKDPKHGFERLKAAAGDQGLMLFEGTNDHGILFATIGQSRKALRYHLGNPQIALKMTVHNIGVALYAPLTMLVYQVGPGNIRIEYDKPSSVFGQFHEPDIDRIARILDVKLNNVIYHAAELKPE